MCSSDLEGLNYTYSTQEYHPDTFTTATGGTAVTAFNSNIVMTASEAYQRASKLSIRASQAAVVQNFRLPQKYLLLEPSDVVSVTLAPFSYIIRLDEVTINGDFSISCAGFNYNFRDDIQMPPQDNLGLIPKAVSGDGSASAVVLDTPLLDPRQGSTPGFFNVYTGMEIGRAHV